MKKSKFTEEQIVFALKEYQQGTKVNVITRKLGMSAATFYPWQDNMGSEFNAKARRDFRIIMAKEISNETKPIHRRVNSPGIKGPRS